jgi:acyl-[acyl carrier protein]--UDP-N-acetylglucosamine O-acyltransferase
MSNQTVLEGHVIFYDFINNGWSLGVYQFCKIGKYLMLGALSKPLKISFNIC